jgi:hypothetical protein
MCYFFHTEEKEQKRRRRKGAQMFVKIMLTKFESQSGNAESLSCHCLCGQHSMILCQGVDWSLCDQFYNVLGRLSG